MSIKKKRDKFITVSLTAEDYNKISEYADERDWTLSKAVLNLIKQTKLFESEKEK